MFAIAPGYNPLEIVLNVQNVVQDVVIPKMAVKQCAPFGHGIVGSLQERRWLLLATVFHFDVRREEFTPDRFLGRLRFLYVFCFARQY